MSRLTYVLIVSVVTIGFYFLTGLLMAWYDERQEAKEFRQEAPK